MNVFQIGFGTILLLVYCCLYGNIVQESVSSIFKTCSQRGINFVQPKIDVKSLILGIVVLFLPILGLILCYEYQTYSDRYHTNNTNIQPLEAIQPPTENFKVEVRVFHSWHVLI